MIRDLSRLLRPRSIAVIGGGAWCRSVVAQCQRTGFAGQIWPVHPTAPDICGIRAYSSLNDLPSPPDASFVGVNRTTTIDVVAQLAAMGAGGATCFASGFAEASAEDEGASDLQCRLLVAADQMPILGPNCYGFINSLDGALLWPDQHGCQRVRSGVAILTQSSNIAINLTMQTRALPIAYMVTVGNQAQTGQPQIAAALLDDPRVTAIGLHIEGFQDLRMWEAFAAKAHACGKPVIALKVGKSPQAQAATISHTASLAGKDAGAQALLDRLGIPRIHSLPAFIETLKLLHVTGPLRSNRVASISCSGGEASLVADTAVGRNVIFPPLSDTRKEALRKALGPLVALANPLDYNTYIWRDAPAMATAWAAMMAPDIAMTMVIVDFPRPDRCDPSDWDCTIEAAIAAKARTGAQVALVATLPELLPEDIAQRLIANGVAPLNGLVEAIDAIEAAASIMPPDPTPLLLPTPATDAAILTEAEAKRKLAAFGLPTPKSARATDAESAHKASLTLRFPLVLKGEGHAHKTEAGAVVLNLKNAGQVRDAARAMAASSYLLEEMITDTVAELLVGIAKDPAHGFVLTIASGGILTELMQDSQSLLVPAPPDAVKQALFRLRVVKLLTGYRGKPGADIPSILSAVSAIQSYVLANAHKVAEVEVNPLLCTPFNAIAADALIREAP